MQYTAGARQTVRRADRCRSGLSSTIINCARLAVTSKKKRLESVFVAGGLNLKITALWAIS
jgi:hypothetical protein